MLTPRDAPERPPRRPTGPEHVRTTGRIASLLRMTNPSLFLNGNLIGTWTRSTMDSSHHLPLFVDTTCCDAKRASNSGRSKPFKGVAFCIDLLCSASNSSLASLPARARRETSGGFKTSKGTPDQALFYAAPRAPGSPVVRLVCPVRTSSFQVGLPKRTPRHIDFTPEDIRVLTGDSSFVRDGT